MKDCLSIWFSRKDGKWQADLTIKCDGKTYTASVNGASRMICALTLMGQALKWYDKNAEDVA